MRTPYYVVKSMSTKWSSEALGKDGSVDFAALLKDESTVILLRGKNVFGDLIYCYLKITYGDIAKLQEAVGAPGTFNITDFGSVIAGGKGEPPPEVEAEIALTYPMLEKPKPISFGSPSAKPAQPALPAEKKAWDEY